jgi:glycosyltransferase involved in cell wall biosynthesis
MPLRAPKIRRAFEKADGLSAVSGPLARAMESLCDTKKRAIVIPNGIDRSLFDIRNKQGAREKLNLPKDGTVVVTVGSLDAVKGTASLIKAASMMDRSLILVCVGEGPLRKRMVELAESLGMGGRAMFPGQRPHGEIPLWMNAADVFCLPSIREGRPNVILEAMSCGVPVAASKVGGIPEIMSKTCGALFAPGDIYGIKQKLEHILSAPWDRGAIRAKTAGYSWSTCADGYIRAYENILAQSG